jgi:phosphate transport system substrate-binding protein
MPDDARRHRTENAWRVACQEVQRIDSGAEHRGYRIMNGSLTAYMVAASLFLAVAGSTLCDEPGKERPEIRAGQRPGWGEILRGGGATFPFPLYDRWFREYRKNTGVQVDYQAVGSGRGIAAFLNGELDFGATDAFLSNSEMAKEPNGILHIPTCIGAVVVTYNLPGKLTLQLDAELISAIYRGEIERWSDRRIRAANPAVELPDLPIEVIHRSDASGTTYVFSDFLARHCSVWRDRIGLGKTLKWPKGIGAGGNAGVIAFAKRVPGSIAYTELTYAKKNGLPTASVRNRQGVYVFPDIEEVSKAGDITLPPDARVILAETGLGYPISSFTYLIVYREQSRRGVLQSHARALALFLRWCVKEGQRHCAEMEYAPLPPAAQRVADSLIDQMLWKGEPLSPAEAP